MGSLISHSPCTGEMQGETKHPQSPCLHVPHRAPYSRALTRSPGEHTLLEAIAPSTVKTLGGDCHPHTLAFLATPQGGLHGLTSWLKESPVCLNLPVSLIGDRDVSMPFVLCPARSRIWQTTASAYLLDWLLPAGLKCPEATTLTAEDPSPRGLATPTHCIS